MSIASGGTILAPCQPPHALGSVHGVAGSKYHSMKDYRTSIATPTELLFCDASPGPRECPGPHMEGARVEVSVWRGNNATPESQLALQTIDPAP